jgi:hypothetical protein
MSAEDEPGALEAGLSTPLALFPLPTRLANFVDRRGLQSLADLVRLSPESLLSERNLGRKSVQDARVAIHAALGTSWEDARRHLFRQERGARDLASSAPEATTAVSGAQAARWESFRVRFAAVSHTPLSDFEFPARVHTFASAREIDTVGGLLAVGWDDFSKAKNVGRGTIAATLAGLESSAERFGALAPDSERTLAIDGGGAAAAREPIIPEGARWSSLLRSALAGLEEKERIIATQRSGLAGPIPTLQELGECFGVSRERIRQLESRAVARLQRRLPRAAASRRLAAACELIVTEPEVAAERDAFFASDAGDAPSLPFFVNEVLAGDTRAFLLDERLVLSRAEKSVLIAHLRRTSTLLEAASFPAEEEALAHSVAAALDIGVADARALFGYLDAPVLEDGTRVVGFGRTRDDEVLATLRRAHGPVECSSIEAQHGRGRLPADVVFVDHGLVSLSDKLAGWDRWARRLPPITRRLIEREGPERQWSTEELVGLLATECELPEWMNAWTLGSLLRRSSELDYLGRNVVALRSAPSERGGEDGETKRVHLAPALEEILRAYGMPMAEDQARAALAKIRGVSSNSWNVMRVKRPFLLLDGATIGLYPRDVPGGQARAKQVLGALYEWLFAEQSGLPASDVARFLTELGEPAEGLSPRALRSVARIDGRFRLSVSGAVGLAEWESVRVPTQAEVLEALLEEGGGTASVEAVCARIVTSEGERLTRQSLANLAALVGARLDGSVLVRRASVETPARSELVEHVLSELPERTAAVFEGLLETVLRTAEPPSAAGLSDELERWVAMLQTHAATDSPHIELDQVEAIASEARSLLSRLSHLDGDPRALAVAAIRYVICTDDADTDLGVGGLDDDEAVLGRVSFALGARGVDDSNLARKESSRT